MLTGRGAGVPTPIVSPSRSAFFKRNATGSIFALLQFVMCGKKYTPGEMRSLRTAAMTSSSFDNCLNSPL